MGGGGESALATSGFGCGPFSDKPIVNCGRMKRWKHDLAVVNDEYES